MTDLREGDKVRVTVEGTAGEPHRPSGNVLVSIAGGFSAFVPPTAIEVLERAKPKVGDVVEGAASYAALPVGAVLRPDRYDPKCALLRVPEGFIWASIPHRVHGARSMWDARTLVYLPE